MIDTPSTWTMEHLRGAQRLAQEDADTMERLSRLIRAKSPLLTDREELECDECGTTLPPTSRSNLCGRCQNRAWMRENRKPMTQEQRDRLNALRRARRAGRVEAP
jgi:uncharacterized paraquat-inducible protein A